LDWAGNGEKNGLGWLGWLENEQKKRVGLVGNG